MTSVIVTLPSTATRAEVEGARPHLEAALRGTKDRGVVEINGRTVATYQKGRFALTKEAPRA